MERAVLMMDYLNVTQGANNQFSHRGDKALDLAGKDTGIDYLKAPFTGIVKKIYPTDNAVWLESVDKVKYADGTVDYMTILTLHNDDVSNLKVGDIIKQGTVYYKEGSKGNVTGNHIHLTITKGKFTGTGWYQNEYGYWVANNQYDVHKALYLLESINIINSGGYNWIRSSTLTDSTLSNNTTYKVEKGDNLTNIANKYNTTIQELVRLNDIKDKNLIYVGQVLKLPTNSNNFKKYTGNSLSIVDALKSIGEKSDFEYRARIASINGIKKYMGTGVQNTQLLNLLKQGQLIRP